VGGGGWFHVSRLAVARPQNKLPPSSAALGTAVPVRISRRPEPYSARLHQQLWRSSLLAILGEMVLVGHRFHCRPGSLGCPPPGIGRARVLRADQPGNRNEAAGSARERSSYVCSGCNGPALDGPGLRTQPGCECVASAHLRARGADSGRRIPYVYKSINMARRGGDALAVCHGASE